MFNAIIIKVNLHSVFPGCQKRFTFGKEKKYILQRSLGWEMKAEEAFFLLCQGMLSGTFFSFSLIHAITKENCTKGKTKVRTLLETSSGQESAAKLHPKPTSLPGLRVLLDSCMR